MQKKFVILCCENIRPEVDAVLGTGAFPHAVVRSFPFHCGHVPSAWKTISSQYRELEKTGSHIILCGCGCSNPLDIPEQVSGETILLFHGAGPSLFLPEDMAGHFQKNGALLMLPGLLSRWRQNTSCDKFSQEAAREMYAESAREILALDTGTHPGLETDLLEFSDYLGIPARVLPVGLEYFRLRLMEYYLAWQYKEESTVCWEQVRASEKRVADYSMVADLTTRMIGAHDERTVILQMLDLYFLLFSPEKAGFLPFRDGVAGEVVSVPPGAYTAEQGQVPFSNPALQYQVAETGDGFRYRVMYGNQFIGILSINGVSIPGALNEYLNLTHFISRIAGLSITIARTYQDLERALAARDVEIVERKRAEGALQMAIRKLNMLSSITRHDILNQITGLRGYLGLSMRKIQDPAILEFVKKADKASESIQWQIEFTRNYQSIGEQAPKWQLVPAIISSAIRQLNPPGIGIKLTVQNWEVFADPLLEKVFYNLMENSLRHGDHVSCMEISAQETENGLAITYTDDGTGISEEDKKRLFQKGFGKHTGLGLFLSREILAITEITITETGEPGRGVQFVITVPKRGYRNTG